MTPPIGGGDRYVAMPVLYCAHCQQDTPHEPEEPGRLTCSVCLARETAAAIAEERAARDTEVNA